MSPEDDADRAAREWLQSHFAARREWTGPDAASLADLLRRYGQEQREQGQREMRERAALVANEYTVNRAVETHIRDLPLETSR